MRSRSVLVVVCALTWMGVACSDGGSGHAAGSPRSATTVSSSMLRSQATTTTTIELAAAGAAVLSWTAQHGGRILALPAASSRFVSQIAVIDGRVYSAYVDGTLIESQPDGAVIRQRKIPGIATIIVLAGRLFAAGAATSATEAFVELIDPTTLRAIWRAEWPDVPANDPSYHGIIRPIVSVGAEVLWIGVGSVLERRQIVDRPADRHDPHGRGRSRRRDVDAAR
jgi:outer membrane protein assembly factor BamB